MKYFFVVQVGPRKDEEANGEEEETLEQWRLAKMEKEKWMQVDISEERKLILTLNFCRNLRRNRAGNEATKMTKKMMRVTVNSSKLRTKLSRG